MKFSCEKYPLLASILTSSRAAPSKSTIPALEGLLVEAENAVSISGYNLKTGIRNRIEADISEKGSVVINARLFAEIVRSMPDDTIVISVDERLTVKLDCGMSHFEIIGTPSEDYPELPTVDNQGYAEIPQNILKSMISQTIFAISDNEARPIHTGSLFEIENNALTVVSVDGYRLALRHEKLENSGDEKYSFVVPGSALSEIEKIASDSDDTVKITLGTKHILFNIQNTELISRRLEGEFLNYRQSLPQNSKYNLIADTKEFISSVERVSLIINDKLKSPVRCVFGEGLLKLSTVTALGKANDECEISGDGENLEIGFNNKYLLDALKAAPADRVRVLLNTGVSPCILTPADDKDNFIYMILPVRLKSGDK